MATLTALVVLPSLETSSSTSFAMPEHRRAAIAAGVVAVVPYPVIRHHQLMREEEGSPPG